MEPCEQQINIIKGESYRLQLCVGMRNRRAVLRTRERFYKGPGWQQAGLNHGVGSGREEIWVILQSKYLKCLEKTSKGADREVGGHSRFYCHR